MCCLQETYLSHKNKGRFKEKGWKIILQANNIHRKVGVAILISDKMNFKITKVTTDKDGHFIMIKEALHQEDMTLLNTYACSQGALTYWEGQYDISNLLGCSESNNKKEVYIITGLSQETREVPSKQPNVTS